MLCTSELYMDNSVHPDNVADFIDDSVWALCSSYLTVLQSPPGAVSFGRDIMFNIPYIAI